MIRFMTCCLIFSATGAFAYQASLTGSGARAMGMGGAFIAVADDATAISWNPAGLTRLDTPEVGAAVTFGSGGWDLSLGDTYGDVLMSDIDMDSKLTLNFASGVYPLNLGTRHAVGALAYRRYWDFTQKTTQTFTYFEEIPVDVDGDGYVDGYTDQVKYVDDVSGAVAALTPAFAVQLSPRFSIGATASIMTGGRDATTEESFTYYDYYYGFQDSYQDESTASNGYSGFTGELGVLADLSSQIRVGAVASLPWTLKIKDQEIDGRAVGDDVEQRLPAFFGAGLAVKPMPNTTLAFDIRHHAWSKVELDGQEVDWPDATVLRGGVEYLLIGQSAVLPLRAGYFVEPLPEREVEGVDSAYNPVYGDQLKNKAFTVGVGLVMGSITLDACFARTTLKFDDAYGTNTITDNAFTLSTVVHLGQGSH
ncbi:hypothetical protein JXA88_08660 [Candidatus Fermentibacteria bacterium]|nr:hypothetical protein [Candidatus Fermentibacteria bacterium]